jgi:hypothetical protein
MSPPVNTLSRAHQSICTLTHRSSVSATSLSWASLIDTSSRNGATWRMPSKLCSCIWLSSSSSITCPYECRMGTSRVFHCTNEKRVMDHFSLVSTSFTSIPNCLSAPSQMSSTASRASNTRLSIKCDSLNDSLSIENDSEATLVISAQCRGLTDSLLSWVIKGKKSEKSVMCFRSSL